jgi:SRSO17 transposase
MEALAPSATRRNLGDRPVDGTEETGLAVDRGGIVVMPRRGTIDGCRVAAGCEDLAELVKLIRCEADLRQWLEGERRPYVLAVRANQYVWAGLRQATVAALARSLPKRPWHKITIAAGNKGPRRYAWAWLVINSDLGPGRRRWLLVRKSHDDPEELAYYIAAGPRRTTLTLLAMTAGARWSIEGPSSRVSRRPAWPTTRVRSWTGWSRHITLSLLAHAVLAVVRKLAGGPPQERRRRARI